MYIPYKNKQANPSSPTPVETIDCHDVQADVLATDLSENDKIPSLKQLKTETKVPTKAINALNEQLKNAQASASDALQRVTTVEEQTASVDLTQLMTVQQQLVADMTALKTIVTRLQGYHEEEAGYGDPTQGNDDPQQGQGENTDNPDNPQQDDPSQQQGGGDDTGNDNPQQDDHNNPTPIVYPEYDANGLPTKANAVYGMVLASEGGGSGLWKRVDLDYNDVEFDPTVHRTWANIREIENENGKFVEFPVTWVKSETISEGKYVGKNCWWIADGPVEGFHVHPSFMGADGNPHPLRISKYMASINSTNNRPHSVDLGFSTGYAHGERDVIVNTVNSLNTSTVDGYKLYSIFDHHLLTRMMLTEFGHPDAQQYVVNGVDWSTAWFDAKHLVYHGVTDVFCINYQDGNANRSFWLTLGGISFINNVCYVMKNDGSGETVNTHETIKINGYPVNFLLTRGDGFDLGDLFIASGYTSNNVTGSVPDVQSIGNDNYVNIEPIYRNFNDNGSFSITDSDGSGLYRISQVPIQ